MSPPTRRVPSSTVLPLCCGCTPLTPSPPPLGDRVAQAEPYYSLNPGLFDSVEHWKYRDLQKLAKTLGISAGGKREDVVMRLQEYHRERRHSGQAGMFHSVEVKANDGGAAINPALLSPLLNCRAAAGAPSPAKSARALGKNWELNSPRASAMPHTPKGLTPSGTPARSPLCPRSNGVLFSPVRPAPPASRLVPSTLSPPPPPPHHAHLHPTCTPPCPLACRPTPTAPCTPPLQPRSPPHPAGTA